MKPFLKFLNEIKQSICCFVTIYFRFKSHESQSSEIYPRNISFRTFILLILIILSFTPRLPAQKYDVKFHHITIEDGLSQSSIFSILQCSKGFMWFGTEDGLDRYDGYEFKIYRNEPENPNSLSYNYVKVIYEDSAGVLWIGTYGGGLDKFNRETDQFTHYMSVANDSNSLSNNFVNSICEDKAGTLWIGTEDGLNKFDSRNERFICYRADPSDSNNLSDNKVTSIYEDRKGVLWVGTENGLNKLIPGEKKGSLPIFIRYQTDSHNPHTLSSNKVRCIYEDRKGVLWVGTENGLNKFDPKNDRFIRYKSDPSDPTSLSNNFVYVIYEDRSGELWVGTLDGLDRFDREKEQFTHYKHDPSDPASLGYNYIYSIYEDRSGVLWIGTHVGLNKFDQRKKRFILYRSKPGVLNSLSSNDIFSIYEDRAGVFWLGTYGGGLDKFDREKGEFTHYRHDPHDPTSLSSNLVRAVYKDRSGVLWLGTYGGGLDKFDPEKGEFIHYKADPSDLTSLSSNLVRSVYEDRSGGLWIGTENGLNKFDPRNKRSIRYKANSSDPKSLSNNFVYVIYEDRSGELWVGTLDGLDRFDREKEQFTNYKHDPNDPTSLSNSEILSIHEDRLGGLWVGTPGGLNKFDRAEQTFTYYTEKDGLPNNLIYAILEDNNNNLWLSTNKGLSKFNPQTEEFKNYDVKDGLQSNEFNLGSCYKSRDGEMFFGGINGFNSFYPESIRKNPYIPLVVITDFQIFNKSVPIGKDTNGCSILKESIIETKEIKLSHRDRVISFEFAALHYASPDKNEYAYKMEGFEKEWNYVGNRHFATYTNLPPGDYIFRVKGSNNDGLWNEEGISLKITVTPPFWQTWWFIGFVITGIVLSILMVYRIRTHTIKEQKKRLEKRVEERTSELQEQITERKRTEEALQREKAHLDKLFESAQEAIVLTDYNGRVLRINSEFARLFGYTPEEVLGQLLDDLVSSGELKKEAVSYTKNLTDGKNIAFESVRRRKDGSLIHVSAIGSPIIVGNKQEATYSIYRDITKRKRAEEDVKRRAAQAALIYKTGKRISSKLKLKELFFEIVTAVSEAFNYYSVSLFLVDEEPKWITMQSIAGGNVDIVPPGYKLQIGEGMTGNAVLTGKTQVSNNIRKDPHYVSFGEEKTKSELTVPIKRANEVIGVFDIQSDEFNAFDETDVTAMETLSTQIASAIENARLYEKAQREITERKRVEVQLSESLKEKEVLLKEIHHRVKNNMQIISSLLRLQSWHIKNKKMREMFEVSQSRIRSMALIHEKLYQSQDLARIDFYDYIKSLTNSLVSTYRVGLEPITFKLDIKKVYFDINTAIPLGLIINELVTNSLKYAFPEQRAWGETDNSKGEIFLSLHSYKGRVSLIVRDNGMGLPKDFNFRKTESMGLQLVNDLVAQLDGTIELQEEGGTSFKITFNVQE